MSQQKSVLNPTNSFSLLKIPQWEGGPVGVEPIGSLVLSFFGIVPDIATISVLVIKIEDMG